MYRLFGAVSRACRNGANSFRGYASQANLQRTVLHDLHQSHGGRMVPFAGWSMPVLYDNMSIIESTLHTRKHASLFDVSHMLQLEVTGKDAESFLESVLVADLQALPEGSGTLSVLTNERGGVIDDCIVTRTGNSSFFIVLNAGCAQKDLEHLNDQLDKFKGGANQVTLTTLDDRSLVALQGPQMKTVLQEGIKEDISMLYFMTSSIFEVFGIPGCRVSRCGYTGEDGVEISVPSEKAVQLTEKLLQYENVQLAGLGARDTLRLEAGLCLYGNDLTEEITPIEAGLAWCIGRRRKVDGGFLGSDTILHQLKNKPERRRVGLTSQGPPARQGTPVVGPSGEAVGNVTSGCPSPTLGLNIAMAYVSKGYFKAGTKVDLKVRKNIINATVTKMPFVPAHYYVKA